tara:strand:- start:114 stop:356 length:243 start_codon:yes stop_codon:yes gene_type:complete
MAFWIVEKRDDAIMGFVSGVQAQHPMAGPFDTFDQALEVKAREYSGSGAYYYTIVESETMPEPSKSVYEFTDAEWEFDDV